MAMTVSALTLLGLEAAWQAVLELTNWRKANGHFAGRRAQQARFWFEEDVKQGALDVLNRQEIKNEIDRLGLQVEAGELSPARAAEQILKHLSRRE
jgi:LAO/AO transport system kinase